MRWARWLRGQPYVGETPFLRVAIVSLVHTFDPSWRCRPFCALKWASPHRYRPVYWLNDQVANATRLTCLCACVCVWIRQRGACFPSRCVCVCQCAPTCLASARLILSCCACGGKQTLAERISEQVPEQRAKLKSIKEKYGKETLGTCSVDMAIGGMRSVKSMLYETSLLDAEEVCPKKASDRLQTSLSRCPVRGGWTAGHPLPWLHHPRGVQTAAQGPGRQ